MNYLAAINSVLVRLRERTVESVNENEYSSLVGVLINDSLQQVEQAWDWSALRTSLTVTTTSGIFNYELNGSQNSIKVLDAVNATNQDVVQYQTAAWFNKRYLTQTPETGSPRYYSFNGTGTDGDTLVDLYPKPDGVYSLRFNVVQRSLDLAAEADKITVPFRPVVLLAYAKAVEERGEDNGQTGNTAYIAANASLSDAIALDASKHPEELEWYSV
jgi:hypothetical protein|tara:strand:- start:19 stop:666 length:648 start_codon:yes stop_codon:yes gene_type:complete